MRIRIRIRELTGKEVAVVISDTYGRPFRWGVINLAIGFSGINPYRDYIGIPDRDGYVMKVTRVAIVDEIASAAELVIGQGAENIPFAIIRGVDYQVDEESGYQDLYMSRENWLFR
jgi:coenzyme F420-0:L-glutamate ligase/coenzyme F420-1:gamma-L-glutamate ligase